MNDSPASDPPDGIYAMIVVIHKACNSPAIETDTLMGEACSLPADSFPFTCFSCLEEIVDASELRLSEEIRM